MHCSLEPSPRSFRSRAAAAPHALAVWSADGTSRTLLFEAGDRLSSSELVQAEAVVRFLDHFASTRSELGFGVVEEVVIDSARGTRRALIPFSAASGGDCLLGLDLDPSTPYPSTRVRSLVSRLTWQIAPPQAIGPMNRLNTDPNGPQLQREAP